MRVVKKINNNVAICKDNNGQELIALGKGIGFPKTPYELKDLSKIDMTFYRVSSQTEAMLSTIPADVIMVSSKIVRLAQQKLKDQFTPNVVFSLADHINFAIERTKKNQVFDFSLAYDVEHLYPDEYEVGREALQLISKEIEVKLPTSEITAIAMHFINAREKNVETINAKKSEQLLQVVINNVEANFKVKVNQKSFAFNRFKIHFQYYLQRVQDNKQIHGEISTKMMVDFQKSNPQIYQCATDIVIDLDSKLHSRTTDDEMFYLMLYINRMIQKLRG